MYKEYELYRLVKSTSNNGDTFYKVYVLFNGQNDTDLLILFVTKEVFDKLQGLLSKRETDITSYVKIEYKRNFKDPSKSRYLPVIKI